MNLPIEGEQRPITGREAGANLFTSRVYLPNLHLSIPLRALRPWGLALGAIAVSLAANFAIDSQRPSIAEARGPDPNPTPTPDVIIIPRENFNAFIGKAADIAVKAIPEPTPKVIERVVVERIAQDGGFRFGDFVAGFFLAGLGSLAVAAGGTYVLVGPARREMVGDIAYALWHNIILGEPVEEDQEAA